MPPENTPSTTAQPEVPADLTGWMLYFLDTADVPVYAQLHQKLLLISEDNNAQVNAFSSNVVFGYVMNEPLPQTFQDHFGKAARDFPTRFRFLQIMNSATEKFEATETGFITYITRKEKPLGTVNEHIFGEFAAYTCETLEEANEMAKYLSGRQNIVMVKSLFAMERERIVPLIAKGRVLARPATPDTMLNQSAFMRTLKSFPESAPNFTP